MNVAQPRRKSSLQVFGVGAVGLGAILAAKECGCDPIVAIDTNTRKFELAKALGATHCIESCADKETMLHKIREFGTDGVDTSVEAVGNVHVMQLALESTRRGWGTCVLVGVAPSGQMLEVLPFYLITGRTLKGCAFGGYKSRSQIPQLIQHFIDTGMWGLLSSFIVKEVCLEQIVQGFDASTEGTFVRVGVRLW
uniref:S-(Hydroxymethyl)glutathione dehydrogenase n=1 Tax=Lygus hesperus TaxID=30085 RepID=A0A0A9Y2H9_LYGHE